MGFKSREEIVALKINTAAFVGFGFICFSEKAKNLTDIENKILKLSSGFNSSINSKINKNIYYFGAIISIAGP